MTDLFLPDVRVAQSSPHIIDNTARFTSPLTGTTRSVSRPGDRWGVRLDYKTLQGVDRARMESFIARMRGAANRVLWCPTIDFPQRGSFPSQELFTNNALKNGATGWTAGAGGTVTVTDRRLRFTFNGSGNAQLTQVVSNLTSNLPFVARYFLVDGKGTPLGANALQSFIEGSAVTNFVASVEGLNVVALVPDAASGTQFAFFPTSGSGNIPTGQIAGNFVEMVWASLSQCMLIDNGPNSLQFSDTLASPWALSAATVSANSQTAADGTVTAASIADTVATSPHYVAQNVASLPSAALDYMICGEFKAGTQNFAWLQMVETTGSTAALAYFNLNTGAVGTTAVGANWANPRSVIRPLGNGWYYCALVARKTNAATTIAAQVGPANLGTSQSYLGTGGNATYSRRVTLSQSSVPCRQVQSGGAQVAATGQMGSALYVKGLPASATGLLLAGDWFQICNLASGTVELKRCTQQLDSDAAGLGFLEFSPPIRTSPNDDDPVIVNSPYGRFILANSDNGWSAEPGPFASPLSTLSLDMTEAST